MSEKRVVTAVKPLAECDVKALIEGAQQREALAAVMLRDNKMHGRAEILRDAADAWTRAGKPDEAKRALSLIDQTRPKNGKKDDK